MPKRLALVIGNSEYQDANLSQLASPEADTLDFARVLAAHEIGDFDAVSTLTNMPSDTIRRAIAAFYSDKERDDLLLLYFSGHGLLDKRGHLYLAVKDTEVNLLRATAIAAAYIADEMDESYSKRKIIVLDCCHSGAFSQGRKGRIGDSVGTNVAFKGVGYGRVILTATDAIQYAFQGNTVIGETKHSLFTHYLIEGLETGAADIDSDGLVTDEELHEYVRARVRETNAGQTPLRWSYSQDGHIVIANNPSPLSKIGGLPPDLVSAIRNPFARVRESAVGVLDDLLTDSSNPHGNISEAAYVALEALSSDRNARISELAHHVLLKHRKRRGLLESKQREDQSLELNQPSIVDLAAFQRANASIRAITCSRCGTLRDPNLGTPCPLCGSRQYPMIGYSYQHEARKILQYLFGVVITLAILAASAIGLWQYFVMNP